MRANLKPTAKLVGRYPRDPCKRMAMEVRQDLKRLFHHFPIGPKNKGSLGLLISRVHKMIFMV